MVLAAAAAVAALMIAGAVVWAVLHGRAATPAAERAEYRDEPR
jgi:hypothetical protein